MTKGVNSWPFSFHAPPRERCLRPVLRFLFRPARPVGQAGKFLNLVHLGHEGDLIRRSAGLSWRALPPRAAATAASRRNSRQRNVAVLSPADPNGSTKHSCGISLPEGCPCSTACQYTRAARWADENGGKKRDCGGCRKPELSHHRHLSRLRERSRSQPRERARRERGGDFPGNSSEARQPSPLSRALEPDLSPRER